MKNIVSADRQAIPPPIFSREAKFGTPSTLEPLVLVNKLASSKSIAFKQWNDDFCERSDLEPESAASKNRLITGLYANNGKLFVRAEVV